MQPEKSYHIYTHANGFENLFLSDENYRYFLQRYEYFIPSIADTLAYCLMPNHIHFLVSIKSEKLLLELYRNKYPEKEIPATLRGFKTLEEFIIRQFSHLFNSYTQAFNKMYKRRGSLFIHSFKRKEIESDQQLTNTIHYIHVNPVHHGFVKNISDWPWSSYQILLNDNPTMLKREEILAWFGNRVEFERFHQQVINIKSIQPNVGFEHSMDL